MSVISIVPVRLFDDPVRLFDVQLPPSQDDVPFVAMSLDA
jgi:hypothetical protein